jgi:hypothetical protein
MTKPPPPKLTWLDRDAAYALPTVLRHEGTAAEGDKGPVRIRLRLEDGSLLALRVPQGTIAALAELLTSLATPRS